MAGSSFQTPKLAGSIAAQTPIRGRAMRLNLAACRRLRYARPHGSLLREGPAPEGPFDVAIVGAGAVGCAVARELTRRGARCVLVEAGPDVGAGTSKANTAILHTGFDAKPGTVESRLVARGYELLERATRPRSGSRPPSSAR